MRPVTRPPAACRPVIPPSPRTRTARSRTPTRTPTPAAPSQLLEAKRAKDPGDVGVLLDLGNAYFMAQRLTQAEQTYSQALDLEPDSTMAQVGLAMVWHAQGDSKRAETALRTIIKQHPDDQDAHYSLAIVCFSTGRIDDAKAQWQTAAGIDPSSTTGRRSQESSSTCWRTSSRARRRRISRDSLDARAQYVTDVGECEAVELLRVVSRRVVLLTRSCARARRSRAP